MLLAGPGAELGATDGPSLVVCIMARSKRIGMHAWSEAHVCLIDATATGMRTLPRCTQRDYVHYVVKRKRVKTKE